MPPHNFCVHAFTPVSPPLRSNEKSTRLSLCVYIHSDIGYTHTHIHICHIFFIHSSIVEYLGSFHTLAIVNDATVRPTWQVTEGGLQRAASRGLRSLSESLPGIGSHHQPCEFESGSFPSQAFS